MKMKKYLKIIIITLVLLLISITKVCAANPSLNVEFDGKEIEMTSDNPNMEWNIENIKSGESRENTIVINSIGSKEVKVELSTEILEKAELAEILNIRINNNKTNEILYDGNFANFQKAEIKIPSKETNLINVVVSLPEATENIIENQQIKIKFKFIAKGEKQTQNKQENSEESMVEIVSTDLIKPIKKSESYTIFIVLGIMIITLIILIIAYIKNK